MSNLRTMSGSKVKFVYADKIPQAPKSAIACQVLRTSSDINGNARSAVVYYGMDGEVVRIVYTEESRLSIPGNIAKLPTLILSYKEFRLNLSAWASSLISFNYHSEIIAANCYGM